MGLKVKKDINYNLDDNLANFFSMPMEELEQDNKNYDHLKAKIYELDMDVEDKAEILNKISTYKTTNSNKDKKRLENEIEYFIKQYNL